MNSYRKPTNTLILTNASDQLLNDPTPLAEFLSSYHLLIELVTLAKFGRIIIICEKAEFAKEISSKILEAADWKNLKLSYSLQDNEFSRLNNDILNSLSEDKDFLELPAEENSKRFLISPPPSPPPEWSYWDKVEEGPNQKSIHDPHDISHILWERFGGYESPDIRNMHPYQNNSLKGLRPQAKKSEVLFTDSNNGIPNIVLDGIQELGCATSKPEIVKTSLPPTSDE